MRQVSSSVREEISDDNGARRVEHIAPAPRVSVQAFCENDDTAAAVQAAGDDRRMAKVHLRVEMGGLKAALEAFQGSPTPNVIILESENDSEEILSSPRSVRRILRRRHPRHRHREHE